MNLGLREQVEVPELLAFEVEFVGHIELLVELALVLGRERVQVAEVVLAALQLSRWLKDWCGGGSAFVFLWFQFLAEVNWKLADGTDQLHMLLAFLFGVNEVEVRGAALQSL